MLDIKFIKENPDLIKEAARKKHVEFDLDKLLKAEEGRLALLAEVEELRAKQNKASDEIGKGEGDREAKITEMKTLKEGLQKKEEELKGVMEEWRKLMLEVPNVPDMSVPEGKDDSANEEIRKWGEKPRFDFEPKDHIQLMQDLDLVDFERGTKVSGFRGYFLKNEGALLSMAIWQYALDSMTERGYEPMIPPGMVRKENFFGTGHLPRGEEEIYKTQDEKYLAGTSEVGLMGYYRDEILEEKDLPKKFVAFSPCFRREAGSYGKDTKGLVRVHEFFKVEQLVLCKGNHDESVKYHEEITKNTEEILQALGLPHRVVISCGGDLGFQHVKTYDIETWVPSENKYRETHSSSYYHDFQTRRLGIRYKEGDGKIRFAHSLNNTVLATPRILVAILENNQQEDGSVKIPEVLQKYIGKESISKK